MSEYILYTRGVLAPAQPDDPPPHENQKVLVMSRTTLNDGITPDERLECTYNEHRPELGPPPRLIGSYYKRGLSWEDFETGYLEHLAGEAQQASMAELLILLHFVNVTLLCIEDTPEYCHRRLLANSMQQLDHGVLVDIK